MNELKGAALAGLLQKIRGARIAILGDFCLDAYLILDPERSETSIETGLVTRAVREQRYSPGGAGNVAANCTALGVESVRALGVVGSDLYGAAMHEVLGSRGVNTEGLLTQDGQWATHVYTKMILDGAELNRVDFGNYNVLTPQTGERLLGHLERLLPELDVVIINQQVLWGIHTPLFRERLTDLVRRNPRTRFVTDSRNYNAVFDGTIRKMNDREAAGLCGIPIPATGAIPGDAAQRAARVLSERWGKAVVVTRGEHGCLVAETGEVHEVPGIMILSRVDTVGAGDSLLAGFAAALATGAHPADAAQLGNYVAAVTVTKLHVTGTATPAEVLAVGSDPDYRYRTELAADPRKAVYEPGADIEVVARPARGPAPLHAIFDHDGTISTLRQGWEGIMEPMMVKAVLGKEIDTVDRARYAVIREAVAGFVDRTTGVQTLAQMKGLQELVREFGHVPVDQILDEHGYKAIYNRELLDMVSGRVARFEMGTLELTDFTVKGSPAFLQALADRGVTLWLASGTDEADVRAEAEALGYARLFGNRIYGAVGDLNQEPKRIVLKKILAEIGAGSAGRVVTFGDGPVELRETVKRGGVAVGVASDELRRWGWNPRKRKRLIEAGASLLVPDFSVATELLALLGLGGAK